MSTRHVTMSKNIGGNIVSLYPTTTSDAVLVGDTNLDTELSDVKASIDSSVPIGTIIIWFGNDYPNGWLPLNGQAISRSIYSVLFSMYGTKFGSGDGSTTFNLPNQNYCDESVDAPIYEYIVKGLNIYNSSGASSSISTFSNRSASTVSSTSNITGSSLLSLPISTILDYAGSTLPDGYMCADGSTLLKTEYSDLYNAIGDTFTTEDNIGTDYFNIPNVESISSNVYKIIKVKGSTLLLNDVTSDSNNVVSSEVIDSLLKRIELLEEALGI